MSEAWVVVGVVGAVTITLKGLAPALLGGRELPPRLLGVVELLAPTLLAALVMTQVFVNDKALVLDARAAGLGAAAVAIALRAPILVVCVVAAVMAALIRL